MSAVMTDQRRRKAHKWQDVIVAWASGAEIHKRQWNIALNRWDAWQAMDVGTAPMRTDIYVEYRIAPARPEEEHPWQREKEAYLAGLKVEYRGREAYSDTVKGNDVWRKVDNWILTWATNRDDCKLELWDRPWLEFRIAHDLMEVNAFVNRFGGIVKNAEKPNLKIVLQDGRIREAHVLN